MLDKLALYICKYEDNSEVNLKGVLQIIEVCWRKFGDLLGSNFKSLDDLTATLLSFAFPNNLSKIKKS